jgi:hypothetical protein
MGRPSPDNFGLFLFRQLPGYALLPDAQPCLQIWLQLRSVMRYVPHRLDTLWGNTRTRECKRTAVSEPTCGDKNLDQRAQSYPSVRRFISPRLNSGSRSTVGERLAMKTDIHRLAEGSKPGSRPAIVISSGLVMDLAALSTSTRDSGEIRRYLSLRGCLMMR